MFRPCQRLLTVVDWFGSAGISESARVECLQRIRNPRVVLVPNLAKSEHGNFASFATFRFKDSRAVRPSVLVSDSDSVSELPDFRKMQSLA
jgi:hypothetical protein